LGQSDARTHRTPKALGAKCAQDAVPYFAQAFGLRQNHAAADAEGTINAKTTMPNKI
jgi:hypothetical protein